MKKIIEKIEASSKKFIRVYAQIGVGDDCSVLEVKNATKRQARKAVEEFYRNFTAQVREGEMPESFLSIYAYDERHNYYDSAPIESISFKQINF